MMYLVELEREIELQPCFFGPRLREVLEQKLHSEVDTRTWCHFREAAHALAWCLNTPTLHDTSI